MQPFLQQYRYQSALLLIWTLVLLVVNPQGEFPLNDDFSFAKSVFNLCEEGRFLLDDWLAMTLLTQLFYGVAWCELFGFSFEVLRFSTLVIAGAGMLLFFNLLLWFGATRKLAFFSTLLLAFNPLWFSLSFTFMTDVHFLTWMMAALSLWLRYLRSETAGSYIIALILTLALVFLRQTGLMVALAAGVAILFKGNRNSLTLLRAGLPLLLAGLSMVLWYSWLAAHQGLPETFGKPSRLLENLTDPGHLATLPQRLSVLIAYMGVFTLPLTLASFPMMFTEGSLKFSTRKNSWRLVLVLVYLLVTWTAREKLPWGNILYNLGLGPPTLKDGQFFLNLNYQLNGWELEALRLSFILSGGWFLWCLTGLGRRLARSAENVLLLSCILVYLAFLLLDTHAFDRYFLVLLPLLLLLLAGHFRLSFGKMAWRHSSLSWATLVLLAAFSLGATHDYLSWNRARWAALNYLMEQQKIPPEKIDGGFEFNGWYKPGRIEHGRAKSWWWVAEDEYCVTFGPLDGYHCMEKVPFNRWLPPTVDSLCVLKKN
ncbi:MAG: glycosyltransferase family 39 protein [Saprospiraceae bacterium]